MKLFKAQTFNYYDCFTYGPTGIKTVLVRVKN